jgi:hypothetical protein
MGALLFGQFDTAFLVGAWLLGKIIRWAAPNNLSRGDHRFTPDSTVP